MLSLLTIFCAHAGADGPGLGLRLSGELLQDPVLSTAYGSSSLSGDAVFSLPFGHGLELGASLGYRRLSGSLVLEGVTTGESSWLWYAPVQLTVGARVPVNSVYLLADLGPSVVLWGEKVPASPTEGIGSSGGKFGGVVEVGAAVPLQVVPSLHDPDGGLSGMEVTATLGYRFTFLRSNGCLDVTPCGLNFSALRAGLGLTLRL